MPREEPSSKQREKPPGKPYKCRKDHISPKTDARLEREYQRNVWPDIESLEMLADILGITTRVAYKWYGARRAKAMNLPEDTHIYSVSEDCKDYVSWRMYAAEFGDAEYRAKEINRAQDMAKHWQEYWPDLSYIPLVPNLEMDPDQPEEPPHKIGKRRRNRAFSAAAGVVTCQVVNGKPTGQVIIPAKKFDWNVALQLDDREDPDETAVAERLVNSSKASASSKPKTPPEEPEIVQHDGYRMQGNVILVD